MTSPSFISIGHLSFDVNVIDDGPPSSHIPGGAVAYSALTSNRHGISTGVISSVGDDYPASLILEGIDFQKVESEHTASFANYYDDGERSQVLMASGNRIPESSIPEDWRNPEILFASPLLHELPTDCVNWFDPGLSCLVPSGWLRRWGHDGAITHADMLPPFRGKKWDVIVVSESEIASLPEHHLFDLGETICVTRGENGANVYSDGTWVEVPPVPASPVDPTGAGDVWATAFVIALSEGRSAFDSGAYAAAAAAIAVESIGLSGCPSRDEIEGRLAASTK